MTHILLAEDDVTQRVMIRNLIQKRFGYEVIEAADGIEALEALKKQSVDLVLLDIFMPRKDGLETLEELQAQHPDLPVLMLTGSEKLDHAVQAMKIGAADFLNKPVEPERLAIAIFHALKMRSMRKELTRFQRKESGELTFEDMIGHASGLKTVVKQASKGAASQLPICITGETGTGKEILARAIHGESDRATKPFIAINCAAIPEQLVESTLFGHEKGAFTGAINRAPGKFREAEGGTIFLDEVGELPLDAQAKLLRVLQQKEVEPVGASKSVSVNVRIISATHRNLQEEVKEARFREDLFFRLNVLPLHLPALRERPEDIPALISYFMERAVALHDITPREISTQAVTMLSAHPWTGNVRELENTIQRVMVMSEGAVIGVEDVQLVLNATGDTQASGSPTGFLKADGTLYTIKELEEAAIQFALRYNKGNVTQTARDLGIAKPTLYRRLAELKSDDGTTESA